jgi:hypothetical protein
MDNSAKPRIRGFEALERMLVGYILRRDVGFELSAWFGPLLRLRRRHIWCEAGDYNCIWFR